MCEPTAVVAGISGGVQAIQGAQSARTRDRAAINNHKYQLETRERNWYQTLSIWSAKKTKYSQDIDESNLAAARGYTQAQQGLNNVFASAIQANESAFIKYLEGSGKLTAAGRTGRGINRINTLDIAKLERFAGKQAWAVTRSKEAFKENVEGIRRAAVSNKNKLFSNVAFAPVADAAPPPPVLQNTSPVLGLLGAGLNAYGSYLGSKTPAPVDFDASFAQPGFFSFDPNSTATTYFNQ